MIKDHVLREVVNNLRDVAVEFHGAGQLRERLRAALEPLLATSGHDATGAVWKRVPIEPTDEVIRATASCLDDERCDCRWKVYNDDGSIRCKECAEQAAEQYRMGVEAAPDGAAATAPSEADKLDAARYRKLFTIENFCCDPLWPVVDWMRGGPGDPTKADVDAALDAAIAAEPAQPAEGK